MVQADGEDGGADARRPAPLLTIAIPTYARPDGLRTALSSALTSDREVAPLVEVVVSDNSEDGASEREFHALAADHPGPVRYHRNVPGVGMVGNFNRCIELATGRYLLILHDDDHLLPDAVEHIVSWLRRTDRPVVLFGARVVDADGRLLRAQEVRRPRYLPPERALERLLGRSSFVRFPAIVVSRTAYNEVGGFDATLAGVCDLDMWTKLATRFGILRLPATTVAYVVHPDADTETVFQPGTLRRIDEVVARVIASGALPRGRVERLRTDFIHQFALAGAVRRLRARDRRGARERLELLDGRGADAPGFSWRWFPVRVALRAITARRD